MPVFIVDLYMECMFALTLRTYWYTRRAEFLVYHNSRGTFTVHRNSYSPYVRLVYLVQPVNIKCAVLYTICTTLRKAEASLYALESSLLVSIFASGF